MAPASEEDTIRVLIATDNHVGYEEGDNVRGDDSWQTFDEIMTLARTQDVDMVLLAGDLFHENKPSRKSMFKVMRSLRKNCLGMKPCELQFLSDASDVFEGHFTHINYEDPDINVAIPVFSIHGNHDDPSGEGAFCPLDLLQVAGLVNYFGRIPEVDQPKAKPLLLQKGQTKLALYGLSNVREERMHRNFRDHRIKWLRPTVQRDDWFNLLAVHQNHSAHTPTSYLPEDMLPKWLNMVVWGHEHECLIDPRLSSSSNGFAVMQPGSSVATSLIAAEAVPKHVAILNITGKDFEVEKFRLKTVRPFVMREIKLSEDTRFKGLDHKKDNRPELTRRLMAVVEEMIKEARDEWLEIQEDQEEAQNKIPLPLIRLRVEYTPSEGGNFDVENPQRFSNRFAGKVANTKDVVLFYRKKKTAKKTATQIDMPTELGDAEAIKVDELVDQYLQRQSLKILPQIPFVEAVGEYVKNDDRKAVDEFVRNELNNQVEKLLKLGGDNNEDSLTAAMSRIQAEANRLKNKKPRKLVMVKPRPANWDSDMDGSWEDQPGVFAYEDTAPAPAPAPAPKPVKGRGKKTTQVVDEDEEMDDFAEEEPEPEPKPKGRGRADAAKTQAKKPPAKAASKTTAKAPAKAPAKGRGRKAIFDQDSDEDDVIMDDDDDDVPEPTPAPPKRATAATRSQPARSQSSRAAASQSQSKTKQTTLNFSQKPKASQAVEISDDEISDDDDAFESIPVKKRK